MMNEKVTKNLCVVDGTTLISANAQATKLYGLGVITPVEYSTFVRKMLSFNSVDDMKNDEWTYKFVTEKLVSTQERFDRGIKGMVVVCPWIDFDPICKAQNIDIITFKGNIKYQTGKAQPQVVNYAHTFEPCKKRDKTNYQYLQASNLKAEDLKKAVSAELDKIEELRKYPEKLLAKTGGARSILKDSGDQNALRLLQVIEEDPAFINDVWFVKKLNTLLKKWADELSIGKIPANGQFIHIVHDPYFCFMQAMAKLAKKYGYSDDVVNSYASFESELEAGEIYCNHFTGECGLWRSPMIHKSESQRATGVDIEYLWMYTNLCVLNPKDLICPSLGGADTDGDKVFLVFAHLGEFEKALVDSIDMPGYIIADDDSLKAEKRPNNVMERAFTFANVCQPSPVGQITNWASAWTDIQHNTSNPASYNWIERVLIRERYAQGMAIDFAKTGISHKGPDGDLFPEELLKPHFIPMWLYNLSVYNGRPMEFKKRLAKFIFEDPKNGWTVKPDGERPEILEEGWTEGKNGKMYQYVVIDIRYKGISTLAQVNDYVNERVANLFDENNSKFTTPHPVMENLRILLTESERNAFETIKDSVAFLERTYRNEIASLNDIISKHFDRKDDKDEIKHMYNTLFENMEKSLLSLVGGDVTQNVVAYAAYYVANFRKTKNGNDEHIKGSRSFPWNCFYAQLLELISKGNKQRSLYALPNIEIESVEVVDGQLYVNGELKGAVTIEDGSYHPIDIEGKPYIYCKNNIIEAPKSEVIVDSYTGYINFGGFAKYNQCVNAVQMKEIMENNLFDIIATPDGRYALVINGLTYSIFNECPAPFVGRRCQLESISSLYTTKGAMRNYLNAAISVVGVAEAIPSATVSTVTLSEEEFGNPYGEYDEWLNSISFDF